MPDKREGAGRTRRRTARPPRAAPRDEPRHAAFHLSDEVVKELHALARPGKGEILVKVFAEAAAAFAAGDYEDATGLGEQAKHIALRSVAVRELLGLAYYRAGSYKEAARELGAFRRLSGTTDQNPVLADCYRALGKPERAIELCDEIERSRVAENVRYEGNLVAAGALADTGRIDDAIARLRRVELDPEVAQEHHLRVWYFLGDLLERRGRFTQAREWFEAVSAADAELTDAPERVSRLRSRRG